jgi:uncharacterized protein (TIGR02598 family)
MKFKSLQGRGNGRAFSLVEVTLALGIGCFCLLLLMALLPAGLKINQDTIEEAEAAQLASRTALDTTLDTGADDWFKPPFDADGNILATAAAGNRVQFYYGYDATKQGYTYADSLASLQEAKFLVEVVLTRIPSKEDADGDGTPDKPNSRQPLEGTVSVYWPTVALTKGDATRTASSITENEKNNSEHLDLCINFPLP